MYMKKRALALVLSIFCVLMSFTCFAEPTEEAEVLLVATENVTEEEAPAETEAPAEEEAPAETEASAET